MKKSHVSNFLLYFQISYIRKSDFHILTNGHTVYTRDKRFQIFHAAKSHDWILLIKNVGYNDSGIYECQVSINIPYDLKSNENKANSIIELQRIHNIFQFLFPKNKIFCVLTVKFKNFNFKFRQSKLFLSFLNFF